MNRWCFKSTFFTNDGFSTPESLRFFAGEDHYVYVQAASRLIHYAATESIDSEEIAKIRRILHTSKVWNDLGFKEQEVDMFMITRKVKGTRSDGGALVCNLSVGKQELLNLVFNDHAQVTDTSLMTIYNSILYHKVKLKNAKRVKVMDAVLKTDK